MYIICSTGETIRLKYSFCGQTDRKYVPEKETLRLHNFSFLQIASIFWRQNLLGFSWAPCFSVVKGLRVTQNTVRQTIPHKLQHIFSHKKNVAAVLDGVQHSLALYLVGNGSPGCKKL